MTWLGTFKKYEKTEFMKGFRRYLAMQGCFKHMSGTRFNTWLRFADIREVFAWVQCYAETKKYYISQQTCTIRQLVDKMSNMVRAENRGMKLEKAENRMLWCTEQLFELNE